MTKILNKNESCQSNMRERLNFRFVDYRIGFYLSEQGDDDDVVY
jgi:hypothetical protein